MPRFRFFPTRWFRVSLRGFLAALTLVCLLLGREANYYQRQNAAIRQLTEAGASVEFRRHVPKWLFDLSGGRLRYVFCVDRKSYSRLRGHEEPLEDLLELEPGESLPQIGLYFLYYASQGDRGVCRAVEIERLLDSLGGCSELRVLRLLETPITDNQLRSLRSLSLLEVVDLADTQITDAGLAELRRFEHLHTLFVKGSRVTTQAAAGLAAARPGLWIDILNEN